VLARLIPRLLALVPAPLVEALRRRRRVAAALDRLVSLLLRPVHGEPVAIARGPAAGLLLRLPPASSVWLSGNVELAVQRALADLLGDGEVLFDVGANLGFFTVLGARLVGPSGRVVAFEPHPANVALLARNVELNGFANVTVVAKVVSDASGERLLGGSNTALASVLAAAGEAPDAIQIPAVSIDDFVAGGPAPNVVKLDVEGHEVQALRGMARTLALHRPVIVCELHTEPERVAAQLLDHGYTVEPLAPPGDVRPGAHVLARPAPS